MDKMKATTADAYKLMHDGALALSKVESNGIRIDMDYIDEQMDRTQKEMDEHEAAVMFSELGDAWKKAASRLGKSVGLGKDDQLRHALYKTLKMKAGRETDSGAKSVDATTLQGFVSKVEGLDHLLRWRKLAKARNTFLAQVKREAVDGVLHPFFNLHSVTTYRSSSDSPNFQNVPKRDKEIQELVRKAFIPRPGCHILEVDFSGVEVRVPCFYTEDPNLMAYVSDPSKNMHRDMAMQVYKLKIGQVNWDTKDGKNIYHSGKNECVFPWFYGDWPGSTGPVLFESARTHKLPDGRFLIEHLKDMGIGNLPKFLKHHEAAFEDFWGRRFGVYGKWRDDLWKKYQRNGYVDMLTGFRCTDVGIRNEILNRPIQGVAFHLLLWSLIEMQKEIKARGLNTIIIGQIHDSLVMDIVPDELNDVMRLARSIMTRRIARHWDWINVPLEVEAELSPRDGNWFGIKEIVKSSCECGSRWRWKPKAEGRKLKCPICGRRGK
jgi:DNA polymerase-1